MELSNVQIANSTLVIAQCTPTATLTLSQSSDAAAITGCSTFSGDIALATGISGNVVLDGIKEVTGSITGMNITTLQQISGATMQTIGGTFTLQGATQLNAMNFPALSSVGGIAFSALGLGYQHFGFGNVSQIGSLSLVDTALQDLSGISMTSGDSIDISQNRYLSNITLQTKQLTGMLSLAGNGQGTLLCNFPNLTTAGGVDIRNVSTLEMPVLGSTSQDFSVVGNTFTTLSLPNLTTVAGFIVDNNNQLTNMSVPKLTTVGASVDVWNNSALSGSVNFPSLASVAGSVYIVGAYNKYVYCAQCKPGSIYMN